MASSVRRQTASAEAAAAAQTAAVVASMRGRRRVFNGDGGDVASICCFSVLRELCLSACLFLHVCAREHLHVSEC